MSTIDRTSCWPTNRDNSFEFTTLVCLPPGASADPDALAMLTVTQVLPYLTRRELQLCPGHLTPTRTGADASALLFAERSGPYGLRYCIGAPLWLLDFAAGTDAIRAVAADVHRRWQALVADTAPAQPWYLYADRVRGDHDGYPPRQAMAEFLHQPRIHALTDAMIEAGYPVDIDEHGPALEAHQQGENAYATYLFDSVRYGDALVTPDGGLLVPTGRPRPRVEHRLADRVAYHQRAKKLIGGLDPDTVLVAAHCELC